MDGRIVNLKLVVSDLDRSLAFYTGLFGFTVSARLEFSGPDVTEVLLADAGGARLVLLNGDVLPVPSGSPGWAPVVMQVADVHTAREEIVEAGYELVVEPLSLGQVSILMVADPDGYLVEVVAGAVDSLDGIPEGVKIPHPIPHIHEWK